MGHPQVQGFWDRVDSIFKAAERIPGFIQLVDAKAGREPPYSHFFHPDLHKAYANNLSLWASLEPVFAFAYFGRHGEAFTHRNEWIEKPDFPNYVAWWVADDHIPTWIEAYEMQKYLHEHGATPRAFSFKKAFDAQGNPYTVDKDVVRQLRQEIPELASFVFEE